MKHFADDHSHSFESATNSAHSAGVIPKDSADGSRKENHRTGPRGHEAHASDASQAARETASRIARKEIFSDESCAEEITPEMIDAGASLLCGSYRAPHDWFTCELAVELYVQMRSLAC